MLPLENAQQNQIAAAAVAGLCQAVRRIGHRSSVPGFARDRPEILGELGRDVFRRISRIRRERRQGGYENRLIAFKHGVGSGRIALDFGGTDAVTEATAQTAQQQKQQQAWLHGMSCTVLWTVPHPGSIL